MSDPAGLLKKQVKIHSVSAKPELNNKIGIAQSYLPDRGRYLVSLSPHISPAPIALKADNLAIPTLPEKARGKVDEIRGMMTTLYNDENLRQALRTGIAQLEAQLPPNVKVEHVAGAILLALFAMIYMIGLSKTTMLISLVLMVVVVALPDIIAKRDIKSIVRNLPFRWKEAIELNTGYKPSKRVATGIFVAILLLSSKVLLTPRSRPTKGNRAFDGARGSRGTPKDLGAASFTMEEVYKLGFEDAQKESTFGESLPANYQKMTFKDSSIDYSYDDYGDYNEYIPPPKKQSKIGMGTIMALFALGRTVKELGFHDGRFDFNLFVANARNLPPMKMAFAGFMLYRVLSAFL